MPLVDIVNESDQVIKSVELSDLSNSDLFRAASVFIFNDKTEILLQLRSKNELNFPLHWDISAAGKVDSGESYLEAAKRELFEEIGVETNLKFVDKYLFEPGDGRKYFASLYKGKYSGKITIDKNEVAKAKFFSIEEIKQMISKDEKFHPECLYALRKYFLK